MMRIARIGFLLFCLAAMIGCSGGQQPNQQTSQPAAANTLPDQKTKFTVTSNAFKEGEAISRQYTCHGVNISPPLEWGKAPSTVKTIAIIADDPDAQSGTFVHWVVYNMPADTIGMVENLPATASLKAGGFHGKNDFGDVGYGGPCPPSGMHRYFFKVYALDTELPLKAGATKAEVEKAMESHIVAQGQLMGTYAR